MKFAGVMVALGLDKPPLDAISKQIAVMKFNCMQIAEKQWSLVTEVVLKPLQYISWFMK